MKLSKIYLQNQDSIKLSGFSYNTFDHNNKYEIKLKYKYNGEKDLKTLQDELGDDDKLKKRAERFNLNEINLWQSDRWKKRKEKIKFFINLLIQSRN